MKVLYYAISDCGKMRKENQDRFVVPCSKNTANGVSETLASTSLYAVFDGMGGEQYGEKAAEIAVGVFKNVVEKEKKYDLNYITHTINNVVCKYMKDNNIARMGTTAAFLKLKEDVAVAGNVGDSSIYKVSDGKMYRLSLSHTMMVGSKRVLTQHLGIPSEEIVLEPHFCKCEAKEGDIFILCTDGLTDMIDEKKIYEIIVENEFETIGQHLLHEALLNGGNDNITIVLCKIV